MKKQYLIIMMAFLLVTTIIADEILTRDTTYKFDKIKEAEIKTTFDIPNVDLERTSLIETDKYYYVNNVRLKENQRGTGIIMINKTGLTEEQALQEIAKISEDRFYKQAVWLKDYNNRMNEQKDSGGSISASLAPQI